MPSYTTNYNLHKIELADKPADITVINPNWDFIDQMLKTLSDASSGSFLLVDDLHTVEKNSMVECNSNTLNTPYKESLTTAAHGICIVAYAGSTYRSLLYIATSSNRPVYYQACQNGVWTPWVTVPTVGAFPSDTVYVAPTGNDTTGKGTSDAPFASVTKALSVIPKDLGGQVITVNIANGTYTEDKINVDRFYGGELRIVGESASAKPTITNGFYAIRCSAVVVFENLAVKVNTANPGIEVHYCDRVVISSVDATCPTVNENTAFHVASVSRAYIIDSTSTNCNAALVCSGAEVYLQSLTGTNNNYGIRCSVGGKVGGTLSLGVNILYESTTGGRIYADAQTNIPRY